MGAVAATNLLGRNVSVGRLRGMVHDYRGTKLLVTYHPAYLLRSRSPNDKRKVWEDMQKVRDYLGLPT